LCIIHNKTFYDLQLQYTKTSEIILTIIVANNNRYSDTRTQRGTTLHTLDSVVNSNKLLYTYTRIFGCNGILRRVFVFNVNFLAVCHTFIIIILFQCIHTIHLGRLDGTVLYSLLGFRHPSLSMSSSGRKSTVHTNRTNRVRLVLSVT